MGSIALTAKDTNDNTVVIFVPDWGDSTPPANVFPNQYYQSVAQATQASEGAFDNSVTFFVSSGTIKGYLEALGFASVINVNDIGGRLTFSNGSYIQFAPSGSEFQHSYIGYLSNGTISFTSPTTAVPAGALSIPSYYPTSWRGTDPDRFCSIGADNITQFQFRCGNSYILRATSRTGIPAPYADVMAFWNGVTPYGGGDPYTQGGESDVGGGSGNFDGTSVDVDFASLPTISAVDTGFITLYNPSRIQLQALASYMWSGLFDLDTFKKLFADPMQAILGLSIVPGPVPSGEAQHVKIGNIDSGVNMTKAAAQYIDIDCGTLNVEEFWGAYLDYEPYTKAEIFLPFIGVHQIAVDDIMNKSIHIMYHIDLLSGGCACEIKCGGSVLYTFVGSCAVSIPVTGSDWTNLINGVLSAASAIGTMVATGGATAPAAAGEIASAAVNSLKPSIEKSGSIAGAGGMLAGKVPVLILTRPRQALPGNQNKFTGYPAFITRSLGDLSGYTEVHSIRLSGIDGTESEIDEIEELLKGGVIL